ncbi:MAG TPA: peroxiredoxin [Candidatus Dormibacteraeota bacterium]|nr:peroxiredoxin [Candidatus Dormibacteraeota bacterium]
MASDHSPNVRLTEGHPAPDFALPDQDGKTVSITDFRGQKLLLYFYPQDDTPGCTKEACQFNDNLSAFGRLGVAVLGVSADDASSHQRFRAKYGLTFGLLTDAGHVVHRLYGAYGDKLLYGKPVVGVIRSTFLIDEHGKIQKAWYAVRADGHAEKVLEAL